MAAAPEAVGTSTPHVPSLLQLKSWVREGRISAALGALTALDTADRAGLGPHLDRTDRAWLDALRVECLIARGDTAGAAGWAERLDELVVGPGAAVAYYARADVAAARATHERSLGLFLAAGAALAAELGATPWAQAVDVDIPWRVGAALALVRCGRRLVAGDLVLEEHALAVERHDDHSAARALRALATIAADGHALERLEEARSLLEPDGSRRLAARIVTDLAGVLVLHGDVERAAVLLRDAEAYASREELWPLHNRVGRLLERLGEVPVRLESEALAVLTVGERRVATLALDGLSNRQIAEQLVVSVKAVEGHLSKVYRKLEVSSRRDLAATIGRGGGPGGPGGSGVSTGGTSARARD